MAAVPDIDNAADGERPVLAGAGEAGELDVGAADDEDEELLAFTWELSDRRVASCTQLIGGNIEQETK